MCCIDVSQSVECDHPCALDFLRKDVSNVNDFFRKNGNLNVMTTRQLFDFITSTVIENTEESESQALDDIIEKVDRHAERLASATIDESKEWEQKNDVDEAVFMSQFLPRSLNQVAEVDIQMMADGEVEETYAHAVAALTGNKDVVDAVVKKQKKMALDFDGEDNEEDYDSVSEEDSEEEEDGIIEDLKDDENYDENGRYIKKAMTPEELKAAKEAKRAANKANKKSVKEANCTKRKNKIKKKDKKRAINKTKGNKKK